MSREHMLCPACDKPISEHANDKSMPPRLVCPDPAPRETTGHELLSKASQHCKRTGKELFPPRETTCREMVEEPSPQRAAEDLTYDFGVLLQRLVAMNTDQQSAIDKIGARLDMVYAGKNKMFKNQQAAIDALRGEEQEQCGDCEQSPCTCGGQFGMGA